MKTMLWIAPAICLAAAAPAQQLEFCPGLFIPTDGNRTAVAIDGDLALIGSEELALVYTRSASGWAFEATLTPSDGTPFFGHGVDLDGDTAVVGAGSATFVFVRSGTSWSEQDRIGLAGSVAVSGDLLVIGQPDAAGGGTGEGGAVTLFERAGSSWIQVAYLQPSGGWDYGWDVALDGERLIVGDPARPTYQTVYGGYGLAEILRYTQGTLTSEGVVFDWGGAHDDRFGSSVDIDGDWVVAGSPGAKRAFVFQYDSGLSFWEEQAQLSVPGGGIGEAVAVDGNRILVGAPNKKVAGVATGAAQLFVRTAGVWQQDALLSAQAGRFGEAVGLQGDAALAAAPYADGVSPGSGASFLFDLHAGAESYCTAGTSAVGCQASISAAGAASATSGGGFVVTASGVEGGVNGLFFFGQNGRQANPWGNGTSLQCVLPPVRRAGLLTSSGTPGQCDGSFVQDLNARWCAACPKPNHAPAPGSELQVQLWYRDPAGTSNQSTSLSDALGAGVCP